VSRPRIAVTLGDPRGIGPEVARRALEDPEVAGLAEWTVVGAEGWDGPGTPVPVGRWHPDDGVAAAGRIGVTNDHIVAVLTRVVKDQQAQIEDLSRKIEERSVARA